MRINELRMTGFKAQDRILPIDRFNIAVGPNGSGKSAILLAASFAATGQTPLGKTLDDTYQLSSPDGFEVGIALDNGFSWTRGISADHRTAKLSQSCGVKGRQALGLKESDAAVSEKIGRFAPMFNPHEFLALSSDKQRALFLDLNAQARARAGESADVDAVDLVNRSALIFLASESELGPGTVKTFIVERFKVQPNDMNAEQRAKALEALLEDKVAPDRATLLRKLIAETQREVTGDLSSAIACAITHLRDVENHSKRERDKAYGAAQELSAEKAKQAVVAGDIEQMKAGLDLLEQQRRDLISKIGEATGRESAENSLRQDIERIDREIAERQAEVRRIEAEPEPDIDKAVQLDTDADNIDVADTRLIELRRLAEEAMIHAPEDTSAEARSRVSVALDAETKLGNDIARAEENAKSAARQHAEWSKQIENRKANPWQKMSDLLVRIREETNIAAPLAAEVGALVESQLTGSTVDHMTAELNACIDRQKSIESEIAALKKQHKAAIDARLVAEADARKAKEAYTEQIEKAGAARKAAVQSVTDEDARLCAARARVESLRRQARDILDARDTRKITIDRINSEIGERQADRAKRTDELNSLVAKSGGASKASLEIDRATLDTSIEREKAKIEAKNAYSILEWELTQCTANAESRGITHEVAKGMGLAVKTLRESLMSDLIAPAKSYMDRFLAVAQPNAEAYFRLENDRGTEIFETGWVRDGNRVAFAALSGCERHIFVSALCYALTMMADPPLKLLLIDADGAKLPAVLRIMAAIEAIGDDIGNALITTQVDDIAGASGWNIIQCGPEFVCHEADMAAVVAGGAVS